MERETIIYRNQKYHRYPDSPRAHLRRYYWRHSANKAAPFPLHRQIWIDAHGEMPSGFDIHHKDGNTLNNAIENLEAIDSKEHGRMHMLEPERRAKSVEHGRKHAARISAELRKWKSENPEFAASVFRENGRKQAGRLTAALADWRKENPELAREQYARNGEAQKERAMRDLQKWRDEDPERASEYARAAAQKAFFGEPQEATCLQCGKTFTYTRKIGAKYCSRHCGYKYRRASKGIQSTS